MPNPESDSSKHENRLNHISHGLIALSLAFEIASLSYAFDVKTLKAEGDNIWIEGVSEKEMKYRAFIANIERDKEIEKDEQIAIIFMGVACIAGALSMAADHEWEFPNAQDNRG